MSSGLVSPWAPEIVCGRKRNGLKGGIGQLVKDDVARGVKAEQRTSETVDPASLECGGLQGSRRPSLPCIDF